ncbi:caspase family protein [Pseudorhodoplanes sp.]|uniref:caspase family protein n=1 Tax=Pseudorhodoplanes sp. TaxID=1934341 RepID=UPI002C2E3849|nr:caspase family protein [Pseudorhodoplanes sp.]HWV40983.1 caspase family protein [Pseudorhodoplanes sp.]
MTCLKRLLLVLACCAAFSSNPAGAQSDAPPVITANAYHSRTHALVFSHDEKRVVTAGGDGTIKVWETATGRLIRTLEGHTQAVSSVAVTTDNRIVSISQDQTMNVWDSATGRILRSVKCCAGEMKSFSVFSDLVLTRNEQTAYTHVIGGIIRWNFPAGTVERKYPLFLIESFALSPDEKHFAIVQVGKTTRTSAAHDVRLVSIATGKTVWSVPNAHEGGVYRMAFSPDGRFIATTDPYRKITKIWDASNGRLVRSLNHNGSAHAHAVFSPNGQWIATSDSDGIKLWDVATGRLVRTSDPSPGKPGILKAQYILRFNRDSTVLASIDLQSRLKTTLVETGELRVGSKEDFYQPHSLSSVEARSDGEWIVAGSTGKFSLWDIKTGQMARSVELARTFVQKNFMVNGADRTLLVTYDFEKVTATVSELDSGRAIHELEIAAKKSEITLAETAASRDGQWMAAISGDDKASIKIWDAVSGRLHRTLAIRPNRVLVPKLAFTGDGRLLISTGHDECEILVWDVREGRLRTKIPQRNVNGWCYQYDASHSAISRDGRWIVNSYTERNEDFYRDGDRAIIALWDADSGKLVHGFRANVSNRPGAIAISSDSRLVAASVQESSRINIWDLRTARLLRVLEGNSGDAQAIAFSLDGRYLIAGNKNNTTTTWDVESGTKLVTSLQTGDGEWVTVTPEGFFAASEKGAELLHVVRGFETTGLEQLFQPLYRPDLVREKLAGDPRGLVREAAARLDLDKVLASGDAPRVRLVAPANRASIAADRADAEIELSETGGGIGRAEWRVNGVTVGVDEAAAATPGQPLRLTRRLALEEGENDIEVVAYNRQNLVASVPARANVTATAPASAGKPRMFVLAVGLNEYENPDIRLKYAVPDATALAQALSKAGEGLYDTVNVSLLTDADVRRERLDETFKKLAGEIQPNDVFVFFIGGHGKTLNGRYYFIPQDFKLGDETSIIEQGIAQEEWQRWFASIAARKSILLFDTCESGSLAEEGAETRALERSAASERLVRATGRNILTATSDTSDAFEGYRGHGLFTYNLLDAIGAADGNGNGTVEVPELAAYVHAQVSALSEKVFGKRQVPQVRVVGGYPVARSLRVVEGGPAEIAIPQSPTHQVAAAAADLVVAPVSGSRRVRKLDQKTPVTLVRSEAGWTLVAREGRPLGYVATRDLSPLQ